VKREIILPGTLQTNSALHKSNDKSDKTSFEASSEGVLSLLSSMFGDRKCTDPGEVRPDEAMPTGRNISTEWQHGGIGPVLGEGWTGSTVDSVAKPERPMSRVEALAE
jgi:hypothetical protein